LATEIVAAGGAAPIVLPCDLEQADACDSIEGALALKASRSNTSSTMQALACRHAVRRDRNDQLG